MHKLEPFNQRKWLVTYSLSLFALIFLGFLFVFEASLVESSVTFDNPYQLFQQHLVGAGFGLIALIIGTLTPFPWWQKVAPYGFVLGLLLLIAIYIPGVGLELNGARRWLDLPGFTFQPVEFFKFALILFFATWLPKHQKLASFLLCLSLPSALLLLQPDLGSLLLVLTLGFSLFFLAGGKMKHVLLLLLSGLPIIFLIILISPYRWQRVTTFFNPESDPLGSSFHIRQIVVALGRGGWFGQGLGNSQQKYSYIPEASTDSIFAIVGEETGFVGCLIIICLFLTLIISGFRLASNPRLSLSGQLFGLGITTWITTQTVLNLAAVVSLVPLTGVPLPFFSYGRSSQVMLMLAAGCLLHLGRKKQ